MNNDILLEECLCCKKKHYDDIEKMKSFIDTIELNEFTDEKKISQTKINNKEVIPKKKKYHEVWGSSLNIKEKTIVRLLCVEGREKDLKIKFSQDVLEKSAELELSDELKKWINDPKLEKVLTDFVFDNL
jgi:hypothetical protein